MARAVRIGGLSLKSPFIAAPMAGITDAAYRGILAEMGAGMTVTEMVSGKGLLYNNKNTEELLRISPKEEMTSYQIFGAEPKVLMETARRLADRANAAIDINCGCPVPKVVKNGEGSALLKDLDKLHEAVAAVVEGAWAGAEATGGEEVGAADTPQAPKPVTVKMRIGWDERNIVAKEAAVACEKAGAAAITVHGRTRAQFYAGKADWQVIADVKKAVAIPVFGNGDVFTAGDALRMMEETGCDGVAIGRGMLGNPWIFREANHLLETGEMLPAPTLEEKKALVMAHLGAAVANKGEKRAVPEMRKHLAWYFKGLPGAAAFRRKAHEVVTVADVEALLKALPE